MFLLILGPHYSEKSNFIRCITESFDHVFKYGEVKKVSQPIPTSGDWASYWDYYRPLVASDKLYIAEVRYDDAKKILFEEGFHDVIHTLIMDTALRDCVCRYTWSENTDESKLELMQKEYSNIQKFKDGNVSDEKSPEYALFNSLIGSVDVTNSTLNIISEHVDSSLAGYRREMMWYYLNTIAFLCDRYYNIYYSFNSKRGKYDQPFPDKLFKI